MLHNESATAAESAVLSLARAALAVAALASSLVDCAAATSSCRADWSLSVQTSQKCFSMELGFTDAWGSHCSFSPRAGILEVVTEPPPHCSVVLNVSKSVADDLRAPLRGVRS